MHHPDQKYIDAMISHNTPVLDELYQKFSDKIKWMVLQNTGTETDADDVFQDGLLLIYKRAIKGNFEINSSFGGLLYVICKNTWIKKLKKRGFGSVTIMEIKEQYGVEEDIFKQAEELSLQKERKDLLREKLAELDEGCRQLLRLNWSGKSMDEVAQILKVSYGYARKKKSGCMGKLLELMKKSSQYNSLKW
jgi:RNA polymerase sigma factor (sigma-70 family)